MGDTRLEQPQENTANRSGSDQSGAECGALGAKNGAHEVEIDPDLAAVVDAWPALAEPIKAGILAMIRAAGDAG